MDLKNILLPEKVVTFDFPGCEGFTVDLAYLSKEEHRKIMEKCRTSQFDKKTRQVVNRLDEELFMKTYVAAIVKRWKGLKIEYLRDLVLVDDSQDDEAELEYTEENAVTLMKASAIFDEWVSEQISDLGKFSQINTKKKSKKSSATLKTVASE